MFALPVQMRVVGLKRKSKNGTFFHIVNARFAQIAAARNKLPPLGYANVVKTSKDGRVTAVLQASGEQFTFETSNKLVWPVAKATK